MKAVVRKVIEETNDKRKTKNVEGMWTETRHTIWRMVKVKNAWSIVLCRPARLPFFRTLKSCPSPIIIIILYLKTTKVAFTRRLMRKKGARWKVEEILPKLNIYSWIEQVNLKQWSKAKLCFYSVEFQIQTNWVNCSAIMKQRGW